MAEWNLSTAILITSLVFFTLYIFWENQGIISLLYTNFRNLGHKLIPVAFNIFLDCIKSFLKITHTFSTCVPYKVIRYVNLLCALQILFIWLYFLNFKGCLIFMIYYIGGDSFPFPGFIPTSFQPLTFRLIFSNLQLYLCLHNLLILIYHIGSTVMWARL